MVARLMVIRMPVGMIPDNRDTYLCEGTVITPSYRVIPRTIIRCQIQVVFLDIVLQPIAESRVRLRIEINHMGTSPRYCYGLIISKFKYPSRSLSLEKTERRLSIREALSPHRPRKRIQRFAPVAGPWQGKPRYLQNGRDSGGVIVRPVIDLVAIQHRVDTQMVIVSADNHDLVRFFPSILPNILFKDSFWKTPVCLIAATESGWTCQRAPLSGVPDGKPRTDGNRNRPRDRYLRTSSSPRYNLPLYASTETGLTALQIIIGQETDMRLGGRSIYHVQTFLLRTFRPKSRT